MLLDAVSVSQVTTAVVESVACATGTPRKFGPGTSGMMSEAKRGLIWYPSMNGDAESNWVRMPMTSNGPLGFDTVQTGVSRSMNRVVEPVASVIVRVVLAEHDVGHVPPVTVTLLMRMSWLSRGSRMTPRSKSNTAVESRTCLQVTTTGSLKNARLPAE